LKTIVTKYGGKYKGTKFMYDAEKAYGLTEEIRAPIQEEA
jgi:hypothetical protein